MSFSKLKLGDICNIVNGYAFKSELYENYGFRVIRITNVQKGRIIDNDPKFYSKRNELKGYELEAGDILISLTGNVGRVGIINSDLLPAYLNQRVGCLRVADETQIQTSYLFHYLNHDSFESSCINSARGVAQKNLSTEWLKSVEIPLPSIEIQRKIAEVLDKAQELIDKRKEQIEKLDELIQSVFIDMYGDPVSNPNGWEMKLFNELLTNIESGNSPKCHEYPSDYDKWGVLKLSAVTSGKYLQRENKALPLYEKGNPLIEVHKGDLLFTRKNTYSLVGACAYVFSTEPKLMLPDTVFRFITNININKLYIWGLFNESNFKECIHALANGSAGSMPNISKSKLKSLSIPVPPIELQNKFAQIVEKTEQQKELLQKSLTEMENNFNSIMQRAFKGELF